MFNIGTFAQGQYTFLNNCHFTVSNNMFILYIEIPIHILLKFHKSSSYSTFREYNYSKASNISLSHFCAINILPITLWTRSRCISEELLLFRYFQWYFMVSVLNHPRINRKFTIAIFNVNKHFGSWYSKFLSHYKMLF